MLSYGPGPGPLLAAASAWRSLSLEYATAVDEVSALVTAVRPGMWDGSSAASFAAAHMPYLAWLLDASASSAAAAMQQELAAAAYTAALAAMPTLAELAANRSAHVALVATNFFGINTIPITLNESDYVRMWIQAATTMAVYQASSEAAVASTPHAAPAPSILAQPAASLDPGRALLEALEPYLLRLGINPLIRNPLVSNVITEFIADILEYFGVDWNPGAGLLNGLDYEDYADATQPMWYLARGLELIGDIMQMSQNPVQAVQYFVALAVFDWPTHIIQLGTAITQSPLLLAVAGGVLMLPATAAGGLAGLAGLAGVPHPIAATPEPVAASPPWPAGGMTSPATTIASIPASTPASAPAPSTAAGVAGTAPPGPPAAGNGFMPPYALGPPGIGFGSGMAASASASAKRKAPEPDSAAAATELSAAARRKARTRRRKHATQRQYGDEYMDMDVEVHPEFDAPPKAATLAASNTTASHAGAHQLGLVGAVHQDAEAVGLATLTTDEFGVGPQEPMVPHTWR